MIPILVLIDQAYCFRPLLQTETADKKNKVIKYSFALCFPFSEAKSFDHLLY